MEEQLNKYFLEYEELLKTKDFSMLSDAERSIVSRFSTEDEYNRIRKILLSGIEITDEGRKTVGPDPHILSNLVNTMKSNNASSGILKVMRNVFEYRIPAYQFAMYAVASILVFFFMFDREKTVTIQKPVYITKTDTIKKYIINDALPNVIKPAPINYTKKEEPVTLNKRVTPANIQNTSGSNSSLNNFESQGINIDLKDKIEDSKPKGRTMLDDSAMAKFYVKI